MKYPVPLGITLQRLYHNCQISRGDGKFLDRMVADCCKGEGCCYCEQECLALYDWETEYIPLERKEKVNPTGRYIRKEDTWMPQVHLPRLTRAFIE